MDIIEENYLKEKKKYIINLDIGKIDEISFEKQNIIIYAKNKKTLIF